MWSIDKVKFTCPTCNETIRITVENLKDRENVHCPNCQFAYPDELISLINESIQHAAKAYLLVKENDELDGLEFDFIPIAE